MPVSPDHLETKMIINCILCRAEFSIPPARKSIAKYCSRACMGKALGEKKKGTSLSHVTVEKLRVSLIKKWASGTRKKNPASMYEVTSKKMKEAYATGRRTDKPTKEASAKGLAARDMEKVRAAVRKTGLAHRGVPNPIGARNEAGPLNWKAKFWVIKSPTGIILRGKNLNHVIRTHTDMFEVEDVKFNNSRCKASKGIGALFLFKRDGKTPQSRSWKGWTAVLKSEEQQ